MRLEPFNSHKGTYLVEIESEIDMELNKGIVVADNLSQKRKRPGVAGVR